MTERQSIPAGLGGMAPGPELAAVLAGLDVQRLSDHDLMVVLGARHRQLAFEQAQCWAVLAEVGARDGVHEAVAAGLARPGERWCVWDIRAELAWSARHAADELDLAEVIHGELPGVWAAVAAGRIDRGKAYQFYRECAGLTAEHRQDVVDTVLDQAGGQSAGWLRTRIRRRVHELDPAAAARRYERALRGREVVHYLGPDGTVTISLRELSVAEASAAVERVDALARTAKRAGAAATLAHLRADIAAGLLSGRFHAMTTDDIITALASQYATESNAGPVQSNSAIVGGPDPTESIAECEPPTHSGSTAGPPDEPTPAANPDRRPYGTEVRIGLTTLLGLDDRPVEIPGLGWVTAGVGRDLTARQHRSPWWFAILDTAGRPVFDGITRHRPGPLAGPGQACGGLVEIHVRDTDLTRLADRAAAGEFPNWARLIADLADQNTRRTPITQNPAARFPGQALRRHLHIRDRYCTFIACTAPARHGDIDHLHDHATGGPTTPTNLGTPCRRDHAAHTRAGWHPARDPDGTFTWRSPTGRTYRKKPPPIAPPAVPPIPTPRREPLPDKPDPVHDTADSDPDWVIIRPINPPRPPPPERPATKPSTGQHHQDDEDDEDDEPAPF